MSKAPLVLGSLALIAFTIDILEACTRAHMCTHAGTDTMISSRVSHASLSPSVSLKRSLVKQMWDTQETRCARLHQRSNQSQKHTWRQAQHGIMG